MHVVKPVVVECKNCLHLMEIEDVNLDAVASYERNMGAEIEYESEQDFYCDKCGAEITMRISVWEYPEGAVDYVSIESDDALVVEDPIFSCYDDFEEIDV